MATSKNYLYFPVLPPNEDAVCDTNMTGGGKEGVVKFFINEEAYERLKGEGSKGGISNFDLNELTIQTHGICSLQDLKDLIGEYIAQHKACLVDGVNDFNIKLVLEQEWEELINKLELEDDVDTDLRLFHIKKKVNKDQKPYNFFMLAKGAFVFPKPYSAQSVAPFAVFLLHSVKPEVEKHVRIHFNSWSNFTDECGVHSHVIRGHIFNCLVALSNGDESYKDDEGIPYGLTDGSNWEIKDTTGYDKVDVNLGSTFRKTKDKLCHICIGGTTSDYRLVFWNQTYNSKTLGKVKVYVIVEIAQHSDKKMVKKKGDRHSKERQTRKRAASDDNPEALEREINKIKVVFCHNKLKQADENKASKPTAE